MASIITDQQSPESTPRRRMSLEEFQALPYDETVDRMLIDGKLWEEPVMTYRNRWHAACEASLSFQLQKWIVEQANSAYKLFAGDVGCDLPGSETRLGIDLAIFSKEVIDTLNHDQNIISGVPVLVVEILSPSDTVERIKAKLERYTAANVPLIWSVDPYDRTVMVYRAGHSPRLFVSEEELTGEDVLPGLSFSVASIFE